MNDRLVRAAEQTGVHEVIVSGNEFHQIMTGRRTAQVLVDKTCRVGDTLHFFLDHRVKPFLCARITDVHVTVTRIDEFVVRTTIASFRLVGIDE